MLNLVFDALGLNDKQNTSMIITVLYRQPNLRELQIRSWLLGYFNKDIHPSNLNQILKKTA